jgi:hypothetical protein
MLCGKWSRRSLGGKATWFSALHAGEKQPYLVRALPIAGGKKKQQVVKSLWWMKAMSG